MQQFILNAPASISARRALDLVKFDLRESVSPEPCYREAHHGRLTDSSGFLIDRMLFIIRLHFASLKKVPSR